MDVTGTGQCHYCGQPGGRGARELRPYGPGGAEVCAGCVVGEEGEHEEMARKQFGQKLSAAVSVTGAAQLSPQGPIPRIQRAR